MSKYTVTACDLCGKQIPPISKQWVNTYALPYQYDDDEGPIIYPEPEMNLCEECATKIRDFCMTLDKTRGYANEAEI